MERRFILRIADGGSRRRGRVMMDPCRIVVVFAAMAASTTTLTTSLRSSLLKMC